MIEDLLEHIGIEDVSPRDNEIGARCPLHEKRTGEREHRPDHWSINRGTGLFHCFSCEYSGTLVSLIVDVAKVGLWDAHKMIRDFDVELGDPDEEQTWEPPVPDADLETTFAQFGSPPERAVTKRHLVDHAVTRFKLRWDDEESAWILPIYGPSGDLWGWQAKATTWVRNRPPGIRKSRTLFGIQVSQSDGMPLILVESPLDAVYLDGLGYAAVASFGAAVSDVQMRLIIERTGQLTLALDNDKAGLNETARLLRERWHHRISIEIFHYLGKGKDPGELTPEQITDGIVHSTLAAFW
jgi:DNA primase